MLKLPSRECYWLTRCKCSLFTTILTVAVATTLVGGTALAHQQSASPDVSEQQTGATSTSATQSVSAKKYTANNEKSDNTPQAIARRGEERIKALHDQLGIKNEQEALWGNVAQTMRSNEALITALITVRHNNSASMTATDDLKSYESITQAHADGIKKLIVSFKELYSDMPDEQKKIADKVFGGIERPHAKLASTAQ